MVGDGPGQGHGLTPHIWYWLKLSPLGEINTGIQGGTWVERVLDFEIATRMTINRKGQEASQNKVAETNERF